MELAGKAIVSAVFVVTVTLIYRYYKVRAANAARSSGLENSDRQELPEVGEKNKKDTEQEIQPLLSSQRFNGEGNIGDPTRHNSANNQCWVKPDLKTQSVDKTADNRDKETKQLQTTDELNNGRGIAKNNRQQAKVRRLGSSKPARNLLAVKLVAEPQVKDPSLLTATASINGECLVKNIQAEECDKPNLNNKNSESAGADNKSTENVIKVTKRDYSNNISSQTGFEQESAVCANRESQLGRNNSSFHVVSADDSTKKISLSTNVIETLQDLFISPASDAVKCTQDKPVEKQPTELTENEVLEDLINRQCTAGSAGKHENISSVCKIYPEIKIQRSDTPSVQSTYQVKHEKAKAGNGSEGGLNVLQPCVEENLSDHKTNSTSEMATEEKEYQDRNNTCSTTQFAPDQASLDVHNLICPALQYQMRDQPKVCCSLNSGQDNTVPSQGMTAETKAVYSSVSYSSPAEHPKASNISSETPSCSTKSGIKTITEERTVLRKDSISAIAETPAFLIDFQLEKRECSEEGHSGELNSRAPSVDDLSSSSLGCLVDSLYLSQTDLSKETAVEVVAGANFIQIPLTNQSTVEVMKCRLDLGNCYEILCVAKKHDLKDLQDAAYQVMSDNYLQVLKNPNIYGQLKADERELILTRRMYGRRYLMVADVDVQENVWAKTTIQPNTGQTTARPLKPSQTSHKLYYYKEETDSWYPLVNMAIESISKDCALCTMYNYLFVVAGCQGSGKEIKLSNKVFCYNPVTNIWSEISPLNQARPNCKLVALDGYLYAIGGECLCTVERYDPRTDRWNFTAPLPRGTFAITHKATVCNGEIYVTRGTFYYQLLKYNAREDTWNDCSMMSRKDKITDIAAVRNFIYRFEINQHYGISVYRYHIITKIGYECATKRLCKLAPFQCAVMDDTIYCINKQFMMQFVAHEISPYFRAEDCTVLPGAKGILFPFVLTLPERDLLQTRV